jgi:DNA primase
VSRSVYIKELAERLDIDESAILEQVRVAATKDKNAVSLLKPRSGSKLEETLVAIMLQYPEVMSNFNLEEIIEGFETVQLKKIGRVILGKSGSSRPVTGADLIARTDDVLARNLLSSLLVEEVPRDRDSCEKIVKQYQVHLRKRQIRLLSKKIKEAERTNNQDLLNKLLAEKQEWAQQNLEALS